VSNAKSEGKGVKIIGNVSPLSHVGEIVQDAGVRAQFINPSEVSKS
jgi:hypothetical protein